MCRAFVDGAVRRDDDDHIHVEGGAFMHRFIALLIYYALVAVYALVRLWRACKMAVTSSLWSINSNKCAPAHVALAGYIDDYPADVGRLVKAVADAGAKIVSICANDTAAIEKAVAQSGVRVNVRVLPPAPRQPLVQATKQLVGKPVAGVTQVLEEIEQWHISNHMASEPDVVLVLPKNENEPVPKCIASFSVWQLRLTQFRFAQVPIHELPTNVFLQLVCSATNVPKRFGR